MEIYEQNKLSLVCEADKFAITGFREFCLSPVWENLLKFVFLNNSPNSGGFELYVQHLNLAIQHQNNNSEFHLYFPCCDVCSFSSFFLI